MNREKTKASQKLLSKTIKFYRRPYARITLRWIWHVLIIGLVMVLSVAGIGGYMAYSKVSPLLSTAELTSMNTIRNISLDTFMSYENSRIYYDDGELMMEIFKNNIDYVTYGEISPYLIDGYVAMEDKNFWVHNGIDYTSILRAAKELVVNRGVITQGGSTITQQLLKVNVLNAEYRGWERKLIEYYLARKLEENFTKEQVIEFYCNTNFYQNNCTGVAAACRFYFGKKADEINPKEAATLIGISNSPSRYNPLKNPEACLEKRNQVLKNMWMMGVINDTEYFQYINEDLGLNIQKNSQYIESYDASFALHCATVKIMEEQGFNFKYIFTSQYDYDRYHDLYNRRYGEIAQEIRKGGYSIYTSINKEKQQILQEKVSSGMEIFEDKTEDGRYVFQSSATLIDNDSGRVVAIVGGRGEAEYFNRAYQAHRQPGSVIKPLLYASALDLGYYYPSMVIDDSKMDEKGAPSNVDGLYAGGLSLREALARSTNTIAYRVISDIGTGRLINQLGQLKCEGLSWQDNSAKAISVGGFTYGMSTYEMATAYNTFVNKGVMPDSSCVVKIDYKKGTTSKQIYIESQESSLKKPESVFQSDTVYIVVDMMKDTLNQWYGTGVNMKLGKIPAAGKTGTTNETKDEWFCGVTANYTLAVWVGADTPVTIPTINGQRQYAGAIWRESMLALSDLLDEDVRYKDFACPPGMVICPVNRNGFSVFEEDSQFTVGDVVYNISSNVGSVFDAEITGKDLFSVRILEALTRREGVKGTDSAVETEMRVPDIVYVRTFEEKLSEFYELKIYDESSLNHFIVFYTEVMQLAIGTGNSRAKVEIDQYYNSKMTSREVLDLKERIAEEKHQAALEAERIAEEERLEAERLEQTINIDETEDVDNLTDGKNILDNISKEEILRRAREALESLEKMGDTDPKIEQVIKEMHLLIQDCKPYEEYFAYSDRYMKVVKRHEEYLESLFESETEFVPAEQSSIEEQSAIKDKDGQDNSNELESKQHDEKLEEQMREDG